MGGALGKSLPGLPLRRANRLLPRVGSPITLLMKVISKALQKRVGDGAPGWLSQLSVHLWLMMTSAQVVISGFMSSSPSSPTSPASGSVLTAQSLEPPSDSLFPSLSAPTPLVLSLSLSKINTQWVAWVAQSVEPQTLAQVMISPLVSSSPVSCSVLTAWSLKPASDSGSLSLSLPLPCSVSLSLSLSRINKTLNILKKINTH